MNYYNENDPAAAAWLRALIADGLIPPGDVDERSIHDVRVGDLAGYTQHHFFAGIGGWSHALFLAGWPESAPIWTASCPCQPFSSAGRQLAQRDARHLWPELLRLAREYHPGTIVGEQVAAAIGHGWIDGVFGDLESEGYACGAAVLGAFSVGAPHRRARIYWVAHVDGGGRTAGGASSPEPESGAILTGDGSAIGGAVADSTGNDEQRERQSGAGDGWAGPAGGHGVSGAGAMGDAKRLAGSAEYGPESRGRKTSGPENLGQYSGASPWGDGCWVRCRDGKARRVGSGKAQHPVRGLVDGVPAGVERGGGSGDLVWPLASGETRRPMKLRGCGNAIVPQLAAEFMRAYMECL